MKALVLGGSGFLGGEIAAALELAGCDVVALSRHGGGAAGRDLRGDVRLPDFGLDERELAALRDGLTHVVSAFGSVEWEGGPSLAHDLHLAGTRNALRFAAGCPTLERFVHVSSVLALGKARGRVDGAQLDLGQRFRTWYEYGKFLAEREARGNWPFERRVVRLGPVLGVGAHGSPDARSGMLAAVPFLLRGYPVHLERRGEYRSFVCDGPTAGAAIARATLNAAGPEVWTWFDERDYTVSQVLTAVCSAWGVVPRIVDLRTLGRLSWLAAGRLGMHESLLHYTRPWVDVPASVLDALPDDLPRCPAGYLEATGAALKASTAEALVA